VRPLIALIVGVAALYWARAVLIPVALAVLLTFLLAPVVGFFDRRGLGRVAPVILVVALAFSVLGAAGWGLSVQALSLRDEIPRYRDNLKAKIVAVRGAGKGGTLEQVQSAVQEVTELLTKSETPPAKPGDRPVAVVVKSEPSGLWQLPTLLEGLGSAAVVLVLVIFMLLERQELRNRLIRLIGSSRLTTTTRAMDDAGQRISRYLMMQTIINASFGLGIALGLWLIGLPYPIVWGFLAAALRFLPYVGPWLAGSLVIVFCLAAFPGWQQPLLALGIFLVLELLSNMVMEPWLYGHSAGVSQVALLVSATFWTWLWGPVGLLLATPLTVCLVVVAKHVPDLDFITVLLADQPALDPDTSFYQRLLAADPDEATEIVEDYLESHALGEAYDAVILPALSQVKRDRQRGRITADDERAILEATREIVDELAAERPATDETEAVRGSPEAAEGALRRVRVLGCPARDETDALALLMLRHLLDPSRWEVHVASPHQLASEVVAVVEQQAPAVVCIGAVPSGGLASHTRYLCKRLRTRFPDLRIVVGRWGLAHPSEEVRETVLAAGADLVAATLLETRDQIQTVSLLESRSPTEGPRTAPLAHRAAGPAS
jgi:predicted PurR-regulated permease PerM